MHFCGSVEAIGLSIESICPSDFLTYIGYPATSLLIKSQQPSTSCLIDFRCQYSFAS